MKKGIVILAALLLLVSACGNANTKGSFDTITMEQSKKMIDENPDLIVLDVRTQEEYDSGHIPGALLYPVQEIESRLNELDKTKTYLVVCRSGNRSRTASEILIKSGFQSVYNAGGGMNQWQYEVER